MAALQYACFCEGACARGDLLKLLDMCMIADVIFAVAVISVAAGAVTEFQLRVGHIGSAADGTLVGVVFFCLGGSCGTGGSLGEGDGACFLDRLLFEKSADLDPLCQRDHIQHVFAEEQEIVGDGDQREQIIGE